MVIRLPSREQWIAGGVGAFAVLAAQLVSMELAARAADRRWQREREIRDAIERDRRARL